MALSRAAARAPRRSYSPTRHRDPAGIPSRARSAARRRRDSASNAARRRARSRPRARAGPRRFRPLRARASSAKRAVCQRSSSSERPLNVLPTITKPPVSGSRAPRWRFESQPRRRPLPPLRREHDEVEREHRLHLAPRLAAPAGLVARLDRLHHHALVSGGERLGEEALRLGRDRRWRSAAPRARRPRGRAAAGARAAADRRAPRRRGGARRRSTGAARRASTPRAVPKRLIVSWNARGASSSCRPNTSPSSTAESTSSDAAIAAISGSRSVTSFRLRVKIRTPAPERWTWTRAPSIFHSTDAAPVAASAAAGSADVDASIGRTGRPTSSATAARPGSPSANAIRAAAARSPQSIAARRTAAGRTFAARATASLITPASAPWRSSPTSRRARKSASAAVARAKNEAIRRGRCCRRADADRRAHFVEESHDVADLEHWRRSRARGDSRDASTNRRRSSPAAARPTGTRPRERSHPARGAAALRRAVRSSPRASASRPPPPTPRRDRRRALGREYGSTNSISGAGCTSGCTTARARRRASRSSCPRRRCGPHRRCRPRRSRQPRRATLAVISGSKPKRSSSI